MFTYLLIEHPFCHLLLLWNYLLKLFLLNSELHFLIKTKAIYAPTLGLFYLLVYFLLRYFIMTCNTMVITAAES